MSVYFHRWLFGFTVNLNLRIEKLLEAKDRTNIRNLYFPVCELKKCPAGQVGAGLECSTLPPHAKCLTKMCFDWECEIGWERDTDPTKMVCHDIDECSISGPLNYWFQIFFYFPVLDRQGLTVRWHAYGFRLRQKCDPGYRASVCINTPGSYECQCRDDYVGNGFNCELRRCDHGTFGRGEFDDCEGQKSKIVLILCRGNKFHCRIQVGLSLTPQY